MNTKNGMEQYSSITEYVQRYTLLFFFVLKVIYKRYNRDLGHNLLGLPKTSSAVQDNYFLKRKSRSLEDSRQPREALFWKLSLSL